MTKITVGIVGYGNLGRALEQHIKQSDDFMLIKIFSKREGLVSPYGISFDSVTNLEDYKNKINILFLCGGSYNEIEKIGPRAIKNFNTIDCFDTHDKLEKYITNLDKLAKNSSKIAISACGWDPGVLSIMRLYFNAIGHGNSPITFWGKGISLGHSDAVRRVEGVKDAIQYTIPRKEVINKVMKTPNCIPANTKRHIRKCFVVLAENADANKVKETILTMPNYFAEYKTSIRFVKQATLDKMKHKTKHKGMVILNYTALDGLNSKLKFEVDLASNASFTAQVMLAYSKAIMAYEKHNITGAYSALEIPPVYLFPQSKKSEIIKKYL